MEIMCTVTAVPGVQIPDSPPNIKSTAQMVLHHGAVLPYIINPFVQQVISLYKKPLVFHQRLWMN